LGICRCLRVTFSHTECLVTVVAERDFFPSDIEQQVARIDRSGARSYATLIDLQRLKSRINPKEGAFTDMVAERAPGRRRSDRDRARRQQ
jgi:hypothetical protein